MGPGQATWPTWQAKGMRHTHNIRNIFSHSPAVAETATGANSSIREAIARIVGVVYACWWSVCRVRRAGLCACEVGIDICFTVITSAE